MDISTQVMNKRVASIPAVYAVLLRDQAGKREILMAKRQNTGYCDGHWSLPAGHLEPEESLTMALVREASEELGIDVNGSKTSLIFSSWCQTPEIEGGRLRFFFACPEWTGQLRNAEPEKCSDITWFPLDAILQPVAPEVADFLELHFGKSIAYHEQNK